MKNPPVVQKLEIRYKDLDPYGHVNNAVYLEYFESIRFAYWRRLAEILGISDLDAGDVPGARYVIAEANVRYRRPIYFGDVLYGASSIQSVGDRSYTMNFELRTGETFGEGAIAAEGTMVHVFFDPEKREVRARPEWFLAAVADLEGRSEKSFIAAGRR